MPISLHQSSKLKRVANKFKPNLSVLFDFGNFQSLINLQKIEMYVTPSKRLNRIKNLEERYEETRDTTWT